MNVYDFDGTIIDGDSTAMFYRYCFLRTPRMWRRLPRLIHHAIWVLPRDVSAFKASMMQFLADISDVDEMVNRFWVRAIRRMKPWYMAQKRPDDVILSASPEFLLAPVCQMLGITHLIASPVDKHTGRFLGPNNRDEEKVRRFRACFGDAVIENFYSDSEVDRPMAQQAQRAWKVKGAVCTPWEGLPHPH